jgi:hypothetical protein
MAQSGKVTWNGEAVGKAARVAAARGVQLWAEHVLQQARAQVPHDEGTLERSGAVVPSRVSPDNLEATVVFDQSYAVVQHEDMSFQHPGGRKAKYLEDPMNASKDDGPKLVQKQLKKALS